MASETAERECRARTEIERRIEAALHSEVRAHTRPGDIAERKHLAPSGADMGPIGDRHTVEGRLHLSTPEREHRVRKEAQTRPHHGAFERRRLFGIA